MIKLYKKTNKTRTNTYGCQEIKNINDLNNPFILAISGYDNYPKAVFGMIREAAHAARVYTTQEVAAGYDIERIPVDFLGYTYEKDETDKTNAQELVEKVLYPFLLLCGNEYHTILRQANKINIMTFDNGIDKYIEAEKLLIEKLQENYSIVEYQNILSNVNVIALGTNQYMFGLYATSISFLDIYTKEKENEEILEFIKILETKSKEHLMYAKADKDNSYFYYYLGEGIHTAKNYLSKDSIAKPAISALTVLFLENSLYNLKSKEIIPVEKEDILKTLYIYGTGTSPIEHSLHLLDHNITYDCTPRYTNLEAMQRKELDDTCEYIRNITRIINNREQETIELSSKINKIIANIHEYSSETTYYQILTASNLWFSKDNLMKEDSDKKIREKYEKDEKKKKTEKKEKKEKKKK